MVGSIGDPEPGSVGAAAGDPSTERTASKSVRLGHADIDHATERLKQMTNKLLPIAAGAALALIAGAANATTLEDVKAKGFVQCGANAAGLLGFASTDDKGE